MSQPGDIATADIIIVNAADGLTMTEARAAWPCSKATWALITAARLPDDTPVLRTYPLAPGSPRRITTYADLQTARERLAELEYGAKLREAIDVIEAPELFWDRVTRLNGSAKMCTVM